LLPRQQENVTNTNILIITTTNMLYKSNMVNKTNTRVHSIHSVIVYLNSTQNKTDLYTDGNDKQY